jgi:hypothetical protein
MSSPLGNVPPDAGRDGGGWFIQRLMTPTDAASVASLRIILGLIALWESVRFFRNGWIDAFYVAPSFHFTYFGFEWVHPLPGVGMHLVFLGIALTGLAVAVGYRYRVAITLLTLGWVYVFLLDATTYLNHAYLIGLICVLMSVLPVPHLWSLDAWLQPRLRSSTIPTWTLWLLRFQIAVPYVFGGIAKLDSDWLHGQPLQMWMSRMTHVRTWVPAFGENWLALLFSYGGLLIDLGIVPLLLWRRTRTVAFLTAIAFHGINSILFQIGVFPWLMMLATTIFFEPDWPRRYLRKACGMSVQSLAPSLAMTTRHRLILIPVTLWIAVQILVPYRHLLYPGDVAWTEEGYRFSWRMMLTDKVTAFRITATGLATGGTAPIDPYMHLTPRQVDKMSQYPEMMAEYCRFLGEELRRVGHPKARVQVFALCSLNGRKPQLLVDPKADLSRSTRSLRPQPWIQPLTEPLPPQPWLVPMSQWERLVIGPSRVESER